MEFLAMKRLKRWYPPIAVMLAAALVFATETSFAQAINKSPGIGSPAPSWSKVVGTDGKQHSLADYREAKLVVLVFTCNGCPVSQANESRLVALQCDYAKRGVQVVAVNVNHSDEDTLDAMKTIAQEHGFNFPYLFDPDQNVVSAYGAKTTLHVFVLDPERHIAYFGALDDSPLSPAGVKKSYVRDALDALLAGKKPPVTQTKSRGCKVHAHRRG